LAEGLALDVGSQVSGFEVGDLVGHAEGDGAVQIRITEVDGDRIVAQVCSLGNFYSIAHLKGGRGCSEGFKLDEVLVFKNNSVYHWVIETPASRPWHILSLMGGVKTFEHYR
jgi:hypothetical protein